MPQRRGEETHSCILQAALACFARQGYDATGVAEICRCAGVSKGAFYYHFPSKQALFLELMDCWLVGLDAQLAAASAEADTVPEGLMQMAGMAGQVFQSASGQLPMFLEFWTQAAHDPAVWQATLEPYQRYRDLFTGMIEAGIAEGTLRPVDPDVAAPVVVSLAVGLVLQALLDPDGADWGQVAQEGVRLLLEGLAKDRNNKNDVDGGE
jgi:AcrR family transcriptional regulator